MENLAIPGINKNLLRKSTIELTGESGYAIHYHIDDGNKWRVSLTPCLGIILRFSAFLGRSGSIENAPGKLSLHLRGLF